MLVIHNYLITQMAPLVLMADPVGVDKFLPVEYPPVKARISQSSTAC